MVSIKAHGRWLLIITKVFPSTFPEGFASNSNRLAMVTSGTLQVTELSPSGASSQIFLI